MPAPTANSPRLFLSDWEPAPARAPDGATAWAIGDVHGQIDLFDALLGAVEARAARSPAGSRHLVLLGDYIDRGAGSIAVLERIARLTIPDVAVQALRGNHEAYLYELIGGETSDDFLDRWFPNGGLFTLQGLGVTEGVIRRRGVRDALLAARAAASPGVLATLDRLRVAFRLGGYVFAHAGLHPTNPLEAADPHTLTNIREPFLTGRGWIHDFAVVHGHSIVGPDIAPHRISVDSGAFWTGVLTCVELRAGRARFITATRHDDLETLRRIPGRRSLSSETWRPFDPQAAD